jgi:phage terminase large subunit
LGEWNNIIVDIGRKTFPSLRASVMFDFFEILNKYGLYEEKYHDRSNHTYHLSGNIFRFFSVDQEQKVRGMKRDYLFLNEANEFTYDDFRQLNMRTNKMTILDYNPSDEYHWIYDSVLIRTDCKFYKSTFEDNPFLDKRIKKEIMAYKDTDWNYWRIYGLGERGVSESSIFTSWEYLDEYKGEGVETYGMDFGYNDPTTLVRVKYHKAGIIFDQLLYKSGLTSDLIVLELNNLVNIGKLKFTDLIFADNARPEIIEDIYKAGYNIRPVMKEKGSVLKGLDFMKKHKLFITKESVDMIKEFKSYKWKVDKNGKRIDEPVGVNDHLIDAGRYALNDAINYIEYEDMRIGKARLFS